MPEKLKLGALGGPNTFGGEAAQRFLERYPIFGEIVYMATAKELLEFRPGAADAACAPQQMSKTGPHTEDQLYIARHGSKLYVIGEVLHEYHSSLLVKPGTKITAVRRVLGHTGSVTQSRDWVAAHVPQAEIIIVDTSSHVAAEAVVAGDGSTASIGTPAIAGQFGLQQLHQDIDGHSIGAYWAISPHAIFSDRPSRLVVAGRFGPGDRLTDLIGALAPSGFALDTVFSWPSGQRLYEYDYTLRFGGSGALSNVQRAIAPFSNARLAGAFEIHD